MIIRPIPVLSLIALAVAILPAAEPREFVDLRLQGGLEQNNGYGGALTLMAGNLGVRDKTLDVPDDWGVVLGLRARAARLQLQDDDDNDVDINAAIAVGLIGIGYYVDKRQHCEMVFGYGRGWPSNLADHGGFHNDGSLTTFSGELGWYWTDRSHFQVGLCGGWSWTKVEIEPPLDAPLINARGNGLNAALSLGYRF